MNAFDKLLKLSERQVNVIDQGTGERRRIKLKDVGSAEDLDWSTVQLVRLYVRNFSCEDLDRFLAGHRRELVSDETSYYGFLGEIIARSAYTKRMKETPDHPSGPESTRSLARLFLVPRSGRKGYARAILKDRFPHSGDADRRSILRSFLSSGSKADRDWAMKMLLQSWYPSLAGKVVHCWEDGMSPLSARLVVRHMPVGYIRSNMDGLTASVCDSRPLYRELCSRLLGQDWFKPDLSRLHFTDAFSLGIIDVEEGIAILKEAVLRRYSGVIAALERADEVCCRLSFHHVRNEDLRLERDLSWAGMWEGLDAFLDLMEPLAEADDVVSSCYGACRHLDPDSFPDVDRPFMFKVASSFMAHDMGRLEIFLTQDLCDIVSGLPVMDHDPMLCFDEGYAIDGDEDYEELRPYDGDPDAPAALLWQDYLGASLLLKDRPRMKDCLGKAVPSVSGESFVVLVLVDNDAKKQWMEKYGFDDIGMEFMEFVASVPSVKNISWEVQLESEDDLPFWA